MDLRRLSHVVALADTLHFARAAELVHLSHPAFSRSIQAIEDDLGIRLFDRDVGGVRPTAAGDFVIARGRKLLFEARCLQRDHHQHCCQRGQRERTRHLLACAQLAAQHRRRITAQ